jgi:hypothetical protein
MVIAILWDVLHGSLSLKMITSPTRKDRKYRRFSNLYCLSHRANRGETTSFDHNKNSIMMVTIRWSSPEDLAYCSGRLGLCCPMVFLTVEEVYTKGLQTSTSLSRIRLIGLLCKCRNILPKNDSFCSAIALRSNANMLSCIFRLDFKEDASLGFHGMLTRLVSLWTTIGRTQKM